MDNEQEKAGAIAARCYEVNGRAAQVAIIAAALREAKAEALRDCIAWFESQRRTITADEIREYELAALRQFVPASHEAGEQAANNLVRVANHIHEAGMEGCQKPNGSLGRAICEARGCHCEKPSAASGEAGEAGK